MTGQGDIERRGIVARGKDDVARFVELCESLSPAERKAVSIGGHVKERACTHTARVPRLRGRSARSSSGKRVPIARSHIYNRGAFRVK